MFCNYYMYITFIVKIICKMIENIIFERYS
jgi:hypothetical protein